MKTGINFARCKVGSAQAHNERQAEYLEALERSGKKTYDIFHDRMSTNLHWTNPDYAGQSLEQILEDCRERYRQCVGQEPQEEDRVRKVKDKKTGLYKTVTTAGWSPIREGVCPVKENTQISDFNPLIEHLAAKGVRVISIDIHRDEGYQDPVTAERKYNYHAHIIADWTDRVTGKTAKLNKADMSEVQTVLADALDMERGKSKEETGKDHLTPTQQREKAAAKHTAQLEAKAAQLQDQVKEHQAEADRALRSMEEAQQREADAVEKAVAAEKAASREELRSNLADVGARVVGLFGRGAIAEAKAERDDAVERADAAEQQAAADREAAETAEKAAKIAQDAQTAAEATARKAREEKDAYGREMYESGVADGIKQGRLSANESIAPLQERLAAKQEQLDQANQRAEAAENEVKNMKGWNPSMENWQQSVKDMRAAGMNQQQIQQVFRRGFLEGVQVPVFKHQGTTYTEEAKVSLNPSTSGGMFTWFNGSRLANFMEKAVQKVKKALGLNRGMHM